MIDTHSPRVIAGFGRSGTTWVQDVLAESNELRPVFEPLHPKHVPGADEFAHCFRFADDRDERLFDLLHPFLCGTPSSVWTDYRIDLTQLAPRIARFTSWNQVKRYGRYLADARANLVQFRAQRAHQARIVKFIRANMLLSWLKQRFDARIVFIIRHPAAVVMSQTQAPRAWRPAAQIDRYRKDERLLSFLDGSFKRLLKQSHDTVGACALCWCVENSVALRQSAASGIPVVYYERLLKYGEEEWPRIVSAMALQKTPASALIGRPSQQAWGDKAADPQLIRQYDSWMAKMDSRTASKIQRLLDGTGMNMYSLSDPDPR